MKKTFVVFLALSLSILSAQLVFGQSPVDITFKVKGVSDTTCLLAYRFGARVFVKDSILFDKKGVGKLSNEELYGGGVYMLVLPDKQEFIEFLMGSDQVFEISTDTADLVGSMKVEGSEDNEIFYQYRNYVDPKGRKLAELNEKYGALENKDGEEGKALKDEMSSLSKDINDFREKVIQEHRNTTLATMFLAMKEVEIPDAPILENGRPDSTFQYRYFKAHYWDYMDLSDSTILRTPIFEEKLKFYFEKMVLQLPDSVNKEIDWVVTQTQGNKEMFRFIIQTLTIKYERSKLMGGENIFVHLVQNYYTKDQAFWLDSAQLARVQKRGDQLAPIMIGAKAPNLVMLDYFNQGRSLHNVEAKYTVLYFWAFDCGHCKKVTPRLKKTYEEFKSHGLEVFAVSTKQEEAGWRDYVDKNELDWINCHDIGGRNRIHDTYDIFSTPVIYLLDEDKIIKAKRIDVKTLNSILYNELGIDPPAEVEEEEDSKPE